MDRVRRELLWEVDRLILGAKEAARFTTNRDLIVISTNIPLRRDGEPRADFRPADSGVAIYFERNGKPLCFACDKYDAVWKNLRAIQKTIEALRGIERWGSSQLLERAFTGFAALPEKTGPSCWDVLGLKPDASEVDIVSAWRRLAQERHPDKEGGSHDAMSELNAAKDIAISTVRAGRA